MKNSVFFVHKIRSIFSPSTSVSTYFYCLIYFKFSVMQMFFQHYNNYMNRSTPKIYSTLVFNKLSQVISVTKSLESQISDSLIEICRNSSKEFTGLGIVFYKSLNNLPYLSLHEKKLSFDLCFSDLIKTLLKISEYSSPYHDGFHFIDIQTMEITHVSQYISPSVELINDLNLEFIIPCGAREMTAFLTSKINGILYVGLISSDKIIKIFKNGIDIYEQVKV